MTHLRAALIGVAGFVGVAVGIVLAIVYMGYAPMAADSKPSAIEANLAMKAVHAVSEREGAERKNPLVFDTANAMAGLVLYHENCIMCHGAADGKPSNIAQGFNIPSPQFATDGAEDDPEGATYWKIHHGIRFSAMPAFRDSLKDREIWQLTIFLKHMDALPKSVDAQWRATRSVGGMNMTAAPKMDMH